MTDSLTPRLRQPEGKREGGRQVEPTRDVNPDLSRLRTAPVVTPATCADKQTETADRRGPARRDAPNSHNWKAQRELGVGPYIEPMLDHGNQSGSLSLDLTNAGIHRVRLVGDLSIGWAFNPSAAVGYTYAVHFVLVVDQDSGGGHSLSLPLSSLRVRPNEGATDWPAPALGTNADARTVYVIQNIAGDSYWDLFVAGQNMLPQGATP